MKNEKEIQQLIERFLNGETCNAEEQVLYDYFNGKDVADNLIYYREMFRWYAAGMPENKERPSKRSFLKWIAVRRSRTVPGIPLPVLQASGILAGCAGITRSSSRGRLYRSLHPAHLHSDFGLFYSRDSKPFTISLKTRPRSS